MASRKRYVILTPFAQPEIVASIAAVRKIEADVVSTQAGVALVRDVPVKQFTDWDISELLGGDGEEEPNQNTDAGSDSADGEVDSDNAMAVARVFSVLSSYGVVLFQADLGDGVGGEEGVSGVVHSQRVIGGEQGEEMSAGLLLNVLEPEIEQLVLGLTPLNEIDPNVITPRQAQAGLDRMLKQRSGNSESGTTSDNASGTDSGSPVEGNPT